MIFSPGVNFVFRYLVREISLHSNSFIWIGFFLFVAAAKLVVFFKYFWKTTSCTVLLPGVTYFCHLVKFIFPIVGGWPVLTVLSLHRLYSTESQSSCVPCWRNKRCGDVPWTLCCYWYWIRLHLLQYVSHGYRSTKKEGEILRKGP